MYRPTYTSDTTSRRYISVALLTFIIIQKYIFWRFAVNARVVYPGNIGEFLRCNSGRGGSLLVLLLFTAGTRQLYAVCDPPFIIWSKKYIHYSSKSGGHECNQNKSSFGHVGGPTALARLCFCNVDV